MKLLFFFGLYAIALSAGLAFAGHRSRNPSSGPAPRRRPARILILGATGGTGRQLVAQGLDLGYEVTAFVRDPSRLGIDHPRLTMAKGDILDYGSVEAAVRGQDAVLSALGHKRYFPPNRILSKGTANVLRAMEAHGVRRLVCETSLGIGDTAGRMGLYYTFLVIPMVVPFYFWDKTRQERAIAASGLEWTIVRPGALTDADKRGGVRHGRHVGSYLRTVRISRADVAEFMLRQLESDTYLRAAVAVAW